MSLGPIRSLLGGIFVVGVVSMVTLGTHAALTADTKSNGNSVSSGTVKLDDNDGGTAMLGLTNAALGASDTSCIRATSNGSLASDVRHYATVTGNIAPYLSLKITRGAGATGFDNCTGFTADSTNYNGAGAGVIYDGKLSDYPANWAGGIVDPSNAGGGAPTYSSDVLATGSLVNYWRLGDSGTATIASDTMTGSAGTTLQSHTGETGATWTKHIGADSVLTDANRLRKNTTSDKSAYYASAVPASANYTVEADVHVKSIITNDAIGIVGRQDTSNALGTFYFARYETVDQSWNLGKYVNGSVTYLDYVTGQTLTAGQTYHLELVMNGTSLSVYVDDVLKASATDASIAAAGRAGVRLGQDGSAINDTNSTGLQLDNFSVASGSTAATDSKGTNNGTYVNAPTTGVAGAISGDSNTAVQFDGTNDYVSAARQIADNFSIEFFFKSTQGLNTNAQWWGNAGLVDAEVSGGFNDFGVSLRSDGKLTAGVGTPDVSVVSTSGGFNDGQWHHVVFTRTKASGALALYVDGQSQGSATGSTASLTSPANINLGRILSGGNYFAGTLDEVALYSAALSGAEVSAHYAARGGASVPETWTNGESHDYKFQVTVDNDVAANGKSGAATFTWEARNQ